MDKRKYTPVETTATCVVCSKQFAYTYTMGPIRKCCGSDACVKVLRQQSKELRLKNAATCSVDGCTNVANRVGAGLCEMHYMRVRRCGTTKHYIEYLPKTSTQSAGYTLEYAPGHPLQIGRHSRVYQHRKAYYDAHGEGPFPCHVCGKMLTWNELHIDHLNDVVSDNRLENLAPACPLCNQSRGYAKGKKTLTLKRGKLLTAHGITMSVSDWSRHLGISTNAIDFRLAHGWDVYRALTPRANKTGPKSVKSRQPLSQLFVVNDEREDKQNDWAV